MPVIATEACVIGGGVMGASTAFALASRGIKTVLVERNPEPGRETTARSGAIIRAHYGVPELVSLALEATRYYARFRDHVRCECGFVECGYTVIVDEADVDTLRANVEMHRKLGVNVALMPASDMARLVPKLKTEDIALAAYEPEAGYADPAKTTTAYVMRAQGMGARFRCGESVTAAKPEGSGWRLMLSSGEEISTEQVVLCTGNWSAKVGKLFDLDLPVTPVRAQIVVMERPEAMRGPFPVVSDLINLAYFRTEGASGLWVGSSDSADLQEALAAPEGFNESVDPQAIAAARKKTSLRFRDIPEDKGAVQRGFCGLYETTPDWQPIIDSWGGNLHAAVGFSGHGFKLAPVVGAGMADYVTGNAPRPEFGIFNQRRFADGKAIKSLHTYQRAKFLR